MRLLGAEPETRPGRTERGLGLQACVATRRIKRTLDHSAQDPVRFEPDHAEVIGERVLFDRRLSAAVMLLDDDLESLEPLE